MMRFITSSTSRARSRMYSSWAASMICLYLVISSAMTNSAFLSSRAIRVSIAPMSIASASIMICASNIRAFCDPSFCSANAWIFCSSFSDRALAVCSLPISPSTSSGVIDFSSTRGMSLL